MNLKIEDLERNEGGDNGAGSNRKKTGEAYESETETNISRYSIESKNLI